MLHPQLIPNCSAHFLNQGNGTVNLSVGAAVNPTIPAKHVRVCIGIT